MSSISSISLSGMQAAQTQLQASAHNLANSNTKGFHREEVQQEARAGVGGVDAEVKRATGEGANLEEDVVGQLSAKNSFLANLAVFKSADKMLGTLIDSKA